MTVLSRYHQNWDKKRKKIKGSTRVTKTEEPVIYRRFSDYDTTIDKSGTMTNFPSDAWMTMKIVVSNQFEKEEVMRISRYLHNFIVFDRDGKPHSLDHDIMMVNHLMHLYLSPDLCVVDPTISS